MKLTIILPHCRDESPLGSTLHFGKIHELVSLLIVPNFILLGLRISSEQTPESCPVPLNAYIACTTLQSTFALQFDI